MTYRPNDLVICVDATGEPRLVKGRVHTVMATSAGGNIIWVDLKETQAHGLAAHPFLASRFRPISHSQHETVRKLMAGARIGARLPEFRNVKEG